MHLDDNALGALDESARAIHGEGGGEKRGRGVWLRTHSHPHGGHQSVRWGGAESECRAALREREGGDGGGARYGVRSLQGRPGCQPCASFQAATDRALLSPSLFLPSFLLFLLFHALLLLFLSLLLSSLLFYFFLTLLFLFHPFFSSLFLLYFLFNIHIIF